MRHYNVIDVETTDLTETPEILEAASCILALDADRSTWIGTPHTELFKPHGAIAPEARAVHHISPEMVADRFPITSEDRHRLVHRPDLEAPVNVVVAHNLEFEERFFRGELGTLPRICTLKVALRVFPEAPSHKNGALYYWLMSAGLIPDLGDQAQPMHRAGPDTLITAHLLSVLLKRATTHEMLTWTSEPRLLPLCPIGEFKGKPWSEVEHSFLRWMVNKAGMEEDNKWNARREIERRAQGRQQ